MIKIGTGYYSTEKAFFKDHHANYLEEGFVKTFLVFLNETEFQCSGWKNKESLKKEEVNLMQRGGKYKIEKDKIELIYEPSGWREDCTIINEKTLLHHFSEPAKQLIYSEWKE